MKIRNTCKTNKELSKDFMGMQYWLQNHKNDYSSEHETAIFRAIVTSKTTTEAARKINKNRVGRLQKDQGICDAINTVENLIRRYKWQE